MQYEKKTKFDGSQVDCFPNKINYFCGTLECLMLRHSYMHWHSRPCFFAKPSFFHFSNIWLASCDGALRGGPVLEFTNHEIFIPSTYQVPLRFDNRCCDVQKCDFKSIPLKSQTSYKPTFLQTQVLQRKSFSTSKHQLTCDFEDSGFL